MSMKHLKKELRFYGLPPFSKLGIQSTEEENSVPRSDVPPMKSLFLQILNEISRVGLLYFLPVDVFVYREIKEGMSEGSEMKQFVVPHSEMGMIYAAHRDHGTFVSALLGANTLHQYCVWGKKLATQKSEFWLLDFKDDIKLQLMNREADQYDMRCTTFLETYGPADKELPVNILKIDYKCQP